MDTYRAPVEDMSFLINEVLDAENVLGTLPDFAEFGVGPELTSALLDEAAKLAGEELAPLRRVGDQQPATCVDGVVTTSPGYDAALQQLGAGGWIGISSDPNYGGQGLPEIYSTVGQEMWNAADMAVALATMLNSGATLAIHAHGTEEQKQTYLEKMHSGEWMGTMNLTESGSRFRPGGDESQGCTRGRPLSDQRTKNLHHLG